MSGWAFLALGVPLIGLFVAEVIAQRRKARARARAEFAVACERIGESLRDFSVVIGTAFVPALREAGKAMAQFGEALTRAEAQAQHPRDG